VTYLATLHYLQTLAAMQAGQTRCEVLSEVATDLMRAETQAFNQGKGVHATALRRASRRVLDKLADANAAVPVALPPAVDAGPLLEALGEWLEDLTGKVDILLAVQAREVLEALG
jgi:hypothetical protein